ncbi:MAG: ArnT family glycosyltransferase [Candidatus Hodarchaeota archaeon]
MIAFINTFLKKTYIFLIHSIKSSKGIIALAILTRLFLVLLAVQDIVMIYADGTSHAFRAWQWSEDPTLANLRDQHIWYVWMPGTALWLGIPMLFIDDIVLAVWISSLSFSLATMLVVYGIAKELYGERVAHWSIFVAALIPQAIWYSTGAVMDTFSNFFILMAVWGVIKGYKHHPVYYILSGAALACGNFTRYESWVFTVIILVMFLFILLKIPFRSNQSYANIICMAVCFLLAVSTPLLWMQWNYQQHGDYFHFRNAANDLFEEHESHFYNNYPNWIRNYVKLFHRLIKYPSFVGKVYTTPLYSKNILTVPIIALSNALRHHISLSIADIVSLFIFFIVIKSIVKYIQKEDSSNKIQKKLLIVYLGIFLLACLSYLVLALSGNIPLAHSVRSILLHTLLIIPFLVKRYNHLMSLIRDRTFFKITFSARIQKLFISTIIIIWLLMITFPIRDRYVAYQKDGLPEVGFWLKAQWENEKLADSDIVLVEEKRWNDLAALRVFSNHPDRIFSFEENQSISINTKLVLRIYQKNFSDTFVWVGTVGKEDNLYFIFTKT